MTDETSAQLTRLDGWESRLISAVQKHSALPFSWGGFASSGKASDCFEMAMDCCLAVTGVDPYADERGRYTTRIGALRRFTARGFSWLDGAYGAVFEECAPAMARRGDIGLVELAGEDGRGDCCSVVVVGAHAIGKSETGHVRVPVGWLSKAYQVG